MPEVILHARELTKYYPIRKGILRTVQGHVKAVDGVSFDLHKGETLGVVGESGCGKSTLGRLLVRLEAPTSGSVEFEGADMASASGKELRALRRNIQIVFQDPYTTHFSPNLAQTVAVATPCCPAPVSAMIRVLPMRRARMIWPKTLLILCAPVWFSSSRFM